MFKNIIKIEIQYTLVDNENWLPANLYVLTSINKRLKKLLVAGRGTVVTGRLDHGVIKKGDEAVIMGHGKSLKTTITGG